MHPPRSLRAGLEPYVPSATLPWDAARAAHLLRRTGFGAPAGDVQAALQVTPAELVDQLIDTALALPLPEPPPWHDTPPPDRATAGQDEQQAFQQQNAMWGAELRADWMTAMYTHGLREKMALFWHNHFVTEAQTYRLAAFGYQYLTLLRTHALGDFKAFVYAMGLTPAMLIYLNGAQNVAGNPNENYARELLELFTMGPGPYTQAEVAELARALTGWTVAPASLSSVFRPGRHDDGQKTLFGQTGTFGYDEVMALIFAERATETATFICRKLYRFFVYAVPDEAVVSALAETFIANDFALAPVLRQLLKSTHFFQDTYIGARIKSPADFLIGFLREAQVDVTRPLLFQEAGRVMERLGQALFNPPNVAGWPGHHTWIDTSSFPIRWLFTEQLTRITQATAMVSTLPNPNDPYALAEDLARGFIPVGFSPDLYLELAQVLLAEIPDYEWDIHTDGAENRIRGYLAYLGQLPEFQLM